MIRTERVGLEENVVLNMNYISNIEREVEGLSSSTVFLKGNSKVW